LGAIVDLYEGKYLYELPPIPNDEKDIIGYNHKKKDQYWRTPVFPDEFSWSRMTKIEQYQIVDKERHRFENGVWFFNNGSPTYITGMHYDHLVNATFDFGKCSYYDSHRLDFYFREYVRDDPRCFGQCTIKPRRYGYSLQEITQITYESMRDFSRKLGMMSNNKDKTYETLFDPLVASYIMRPEWIRPDIYMPNNKIPKTELWWNSGMIKKKAGAYQYDSRGNLNSRLIPKPTTVMGYDGNKVHYLIIDEAWKWTLADPYACWKKQRPCLDVGGVIVGKCSVLSTMGDDDSYEQAIESGIQMFRDSDTTDRDENGYTKTGLYQRFISGVYSLFKYSDSYGSINIDQATTEILNKRKANPEGSTEWTYEVRRYPLTKEEAMSSATGIGVFNNQRIEHAITILEKKIAPTKLGRIDEDPKGRIIWTPTNNGIWEFGKLPIKNKLYGDTSNRWYREPMEGQLMLKDRLQGVIGYDAIRYAEMDTVSQVLSNAAIVAYQKFDYFGDGSAEKTFPALWHGRPDDSEIAHYETYKVSKLLGFPVATERQVESFKRRMIELDAISFILRSHYDGKLGFWTTSKSIKDGVDMIQALFKMPANPTDIDYLLRVTIIKILREAKKFNATKTTIYDIIMAIIQAMLGSLQILPTIETDNSDEVMNNILSIIQPKRNEQNE
jgi:hypothetical protein